MSGYLRLNELALLILSLLAVSLLALFCPPVLLPVQIQDTHSQEHLIFFAIRLPRLFLAFFTGAALSLAGVNFQALLKNPLADPYILGVSGGSALGYVVAIILGVPTLFLPLAGFGAALLSMLTIQRLATTENGINTFHLLLTGVIFNSFSFALILILNTLVPFAQSHQILAILMGSLSPLPWIQIVFLAVVTLGSVLILKWRANSLNVLCLGDAQAHHLGLDVQREKKLVFVLTSLLVGTSVSLCGLIGFVGLFVPHLVRLIFGADHKKLIPLAFVFGGLFLALADFMAIQLSHWDTFGTKLPVGAITALLGAPVFVWLLRRQARGLT